MRITHSGNGMLLKDPKAPFPRPNEHNCFSPDEVAPADGDRIAIFAHLGANDKHAERYGDYLKTRKYMVDAWRKRPYDAAVLQGRRAAGLTVRDMPAEVMNDPSAGQNGTGSRSPTRRRRRATTGRRLGRWPAWWRDAARRRSRARTAASKRVGARPDRAGQPYSTKRRTAASHEGAPADSRPDTRTVEPATSIFAGLSGAWICAPLT